MKAALLLGSLAFCIATETAALNSVYALTPDTTASKATASEPAPADQQKVVDALGTAINAYKPAPDPQSWDAVFDSFKQIVSLSLAKHLDLVNINKTLATQLGMKLYDGGSIRVWTFPKVPESQQLLMEWHDVAVTRQVGRGARAKVVATSSIPKLQVFNCPANTAVSEAKMLSASAGKGAKQGTRCLVLLGSDVKSGSPWVQGYKFADGRWNNAPGLFSGVPPFLLQNLQGKVSFSGANIMLTIDTPKGPDNEAPAGGYKITLTFLNDHYTLDSKSGMDPATTVAMQFMQAVQLGKMDLVKAWLVDAKLASIPGYLGLYNKTGGMPYRLMPMALPPNGNSRFRIVTFDKNDLVMDVGRVKQQWAVKALFIAPPDPLARKLLSTQPVNPTSPTNPTITPGETPATSESSH
jgi:hypothetical protein